MSTSRSCPSLSWPESGVVQLDAVRPGRADVREGQLAHACNARNRALDRRLDGPAREPGPRRPQHLHLRQTGDACRLATASTCVSGVGEAEARAAAHRRRRPEPRGPRPSSGLSRKRTPARSRPSPTRTRAECSSGPASPTIACFELQSVEDSPSLRIEHLASGATSRVCGIARSLGVDGLDRLVGVVLLGHHVARGGLLLLRKANTARVVPARRG